MSEVDVYPRTIQFQTSDNNEKELTIYQEVITDVGGVVWDSALMTIHYFFKNSSLWKDRRVLELGSGTGVCGIALAALGAEVIVTDLPERISLLEKNLEANQNLTGNRIKCQVLDWIVDPTPDNIDIILAVDCIYYHSTIEPLINLFKNSKSSEIIIVSEERDIGEASEAQKSFFNKISGFFDVKSIPKSDLDPDYYADDIIIAKLVRK